MSTQIARRGRNNIPSSEMELVEMKTGSGLLERKIPSFISRINTESKEQLVTVL